MNILSIETSCDETAVSIVRADGAFPHATYTILGNALWSQVDIHKEYGGVFPNLAKREHVKTILPLCTKALDAAGMLQTATNELTEKDVDVLRDILSHEPELVDELVTFYTTHAKPDLDLIAVTYGPGLEPALWVGVNFARALAYLYDIPVVPVNHMEGHICAALFDEERLAELVFPSLALLISGGHTEFILMPAWKQYEKIGGTRDDAVGEAFDKVARLLGLPYPGGPEVSRRAADARERNLPQYIELPRPMIASGDLDVSFSGIKTAVRYALEDKTLSDDERAAVAREFEDAVTEVLLAKTRQAIDVHGIRSLIIGGGVSANTYIKARFKEVFDREYPDHTLHVSEPTLATDNSIMIALAGHAHADTALQPDQTSAIRAVGGLSLAEPKRL